MVFTREQARLALGVGPRSLVREIAKGRLRSSRRLGKTYILGAWLLEWFRAGEVTRNANITLGVKGCNEAGGQA